MKDIDSKSQYAGVLPVPDNEVHTAPEYNDRRGELQNSVTDADLVLDGADTHQLPKAMFGNAVRAQSMLDNSSSANAVELTPISGASKLRLPTPVAIDYSALNGAVFSFKAANTNIGNMTVNIGQTVGTLIGTRSLFLENGTTQVPAGTVVVGIYYTIRYDQSLSGGSGAFILFPKELRYTEIAAPAPVDTIGGGLVADGTFHDLDISGQVPAGTVAVNVRLRLNSNTAGVSMSARSKESTGVLAGIFQDTQVANITVFGQGTIAIKPELNQQVIQYMFENVGTWANSSDVTISGFWA